MKKVESGKWKVKNGFVRCARRCSFHFSLFTFVLLASCAGKPPPDWRRDAVSGLETYQKRWLEGEGRAAELAFDRARAEIARTGRLDLAARAELIRCATRVAALDFSPCSEYDRLAAYAAPADAAYARFLSGDWQGLEAGQLPGQYARLLGARDEDRRNRAAQAIGEPLPRLIAAALLFKTAQITPQTLAGAAETASEQGWRRPLLAWLQVQLRRAEAAGDLAAVARLNRQIELVYASMPGLQPAPAGQ